MAKKKIKTEGPTHYCHECAESYDWHSNDLHGNPILCRCKYYKDGVWCKFLKDKACEKFKTKEK